ncbi:MAG: DUF4097 family beta strand repeat protein [Gemmatimonadales bacterium]|nr:DUF4097 family beta strand repeat protein [Gemmatimonadales bacterium]
MSQHPVVPLTALLLLASPLAAQSTRHTISGKDVAIYNLAGVVRAEAGTGSEVVVEVMRAGADAGQLRIATGAVRGRETLRVMYPGNHIVYPALGRDSRTETAVRDDGTFSDAGGSSHRVTIAGSGRGLEASADMRILIPRGQKAAIYLAVGKVIVANVNGDLLVDLAAADVEASGTVGTLRLDVGSGDVRVTGAQGDLDVDTGSGDVVLERIRARDVRIDTGSGDVTATGLTASEVRIDTGSGDVNLSGVSTPAVTLDTGSGDVSIDADAELRDVRAETGSGDITIRAPASFSAGVDLQTSSGSIRSDFDVAVTRREEDRLVGRIGSGRGTVRVESGSGDVRLVRK